MLGSPLVTANVAIITGAAGDLGQAIAQRLSADRWHLCLVDHPNAADALQDVAARCRDGGVAAIAEPADVTDPTAVQRAVDSCVEALGTPLGLVNNAGYQGQFKPTAEYPLDDVVRVLAV